MLKKLLITTAIGILSFNAIAEENAKEKEDEKIIEKIESGSFFKVSDLKSNVFNQIYTQNNSFYFNIISKNILPNLKLEYNNGSYKNKNSISDSNTYINDNISFIDMNLQYGDIVSYYTANSDYNFGANFGVGLRQYVGDIEYSQNEKQIENTINSTVPLSYFDLFYSLDSNSNTSIGTYIKESEFNSNSIKDSGLYFKTALENVDNLVFMASYSKSHISFFGDRDNDSLIESEGLNLQVKYVY